MTILELFAAIKNKWYIVVLVPVICALATGFYCWQMMEDEYTSSVDLYVLSKGGGTEGGVDSQLTQSDMAASQQLANDIAVLASSAKVKRNTADKLGMESLDGYNIKVDSASTNRVITLSVTGLQPQATAVVANELGFQVSATATEIMELKAVNIIDEASVPTAPSGPKRGLYTAVAFAVGLIIAMMIVITMDLFNMTIRTSEEAEEILGVPVIGRLPQIKR
jgi:capsular polysaccharide biosynthesis protein